MIDSSYSFGWDSRISSNFSSGMILMAQVLHSQEKPHLNSRGMLLLLRTCAKLLSTKVVIGIFNDVLSAGETKKDIYYLAGLKEA